MTRPLHFLAAAVASISLSLALTFSAAALAQPEASPGCASDSTCNTGLCYWSSFLNGCNIGGDICNKLAGVCSSCKCTPHNWIKECKCE